MIYQVGKKQCSISGRKQNDIAPLESDFMVQPPPFWNFLGLWPPHPPGISNSLRGGSLDIFWNHTFQNIDCFKDKMTSITGMLTFSTVNPENFSLIPLYHPEKKANLWLPNTLRLDGHPFCVWLVKSCISGSWTVRSQPFGWYWKSICVMHFS